MMRRFAITIAAAASLAVPAGAAANTPTLHLVKSKPFVVAGSHFRANEHVVLTLRATKTRVLRVVADDAGAFQADFGTLSLGPCAGFTLRAVGAAGDTVQIKIPRRACMPQHSGGRSP